MTAHESRFSRTWPPLLLFGFLALGITADYAMADAPTAEAVLRRMADYYKKVKSFSVEVEREQKIGEMTIRSAVNVAIERPNKLAIRGNGAAFGMDVVSDGKTLSVSIPTVKKYIQSNAPASLSDLSSDPMIQGVLMSTLQGTMLVELTAADPYKALMDGVKTSAYVGDEITRRRQDAPREVHPGPV